MRIQAASDLHMETRKGVTLDDMLSHETVDLIVLAGDIATGTFGVEAAAELSAARNTPVVYVLGNHEYYGWHFPRLAEHCRELAIELNSGGHGEVHVLEREQIRLQGIRILGTTLWTDYRLHTHDDVHLITRNRRLAARNLADHHFIHTEGGLFQPEHAQRAHQQSRAWLERHLASAWQGPTVVVTHHAPLPQLGHPDFPGDGLASAFGSDLSMLIRQHPPALWISGHTHANADLTFRGTRFIANQAGYPAEEPGRIGNAVFEPGKVVTVE
ncbi:metallophosphoesterase [Arhodomonas sp. AD133]|uniref:metallophosphoesterase n=1 Tax=Arhodomonas sp. AD133 TaxID=3415009 RepID=UPI003EBBC18F